MAKIGKIYLTETRLLTPDNQTFHIHLFTIRHGRKIMTNRRPLLELLVILSNYLVYFDGINTHDLLVMYPVLYPLDHGVKFSEIIQLSIVQWRD